MKRILLAGTLLAAVHAVAFGQPRDPLINEFVANHTGPDINEFIEVSGDPDADYAAFTILEVEGDSGGSLGVVDGVFPVGTTDARGLWTTGFLPSQIENGTVTLLLVEAFTGRTGADLDADDDGGLDPAPPWSRLVDAVAVTDGGSGDLAYAAVVLAPGFNGHTATPGGASRLPHGADTDTVGDWLRNDFEGDGLPAFPDAQPAPSGEAVNTPGRRNRAGFTPLPPPPPPGLIINEVDADTPGPDDREFIELYDGGAGHTPLGDLVIVLFNGTSDRSYRAFDLDGFHTDADGFFLLGSAAVHPALVFPDAVLQNGADAVALYAGDAGDFPNGTPVTTAFLVDALVYGTGDADDRGLLALLHPGQRQVDENGTNHKDILSLQRLPHGAGGARNTAAYAPFLPTPGSVNGGADLSLDKQVTILAQAGGTTTVRFTLTLTNDGPARATGIEVTDPMQAAMTLLLASASQGTYAPETGLWTAGALAPGGVATLSLTLTAPAGQRFLNRAEITAVNEPDPDSMPGDGQGDDAAAAALGRARGDLSRFRADVRLSMTAIPTTVAAGETVAFTLTIANDGPASTAGVEVTNRLSEGLAYRADTGAGRYDPVTGRWAVGRLRAGATDTLAIIATATGHGTFTNTAEVTGGHLPDPDALAGNGDPHEDDLAAVSITVQPSTGKRAGRPAAFMLGPGYPNPFNPATVIPFLLPEATHVTLRVYDVQGRLVETLANGRMAAGRHAVRWEAARHPSGLYLARLEAAGTMAMLRLMLAK